jgi:glycosyltransferase involved in cell wall biosynthesis
VRILQVHTHYRQAGGEDAVVAHEGELLRGAGHIVEEMRFENPTGATRAAGALLAAPWNPRAAATVRKTVERAKPDVAHVHNTWFAASPSVFRALAVAGVPVVFTAHNYRLVCSNAQLLRDGTPCELCVGTHPWHGVRFGCYRGSRVQSLPAAATIALNRKMGTWHRHVDVFIALTEFAGARLVAAGIPAERIQVKPNFVRDPGPRSALPSVSRTILFVGRLSKEKGVEVLLEAWRGAGLEGLELVVIGDGPLRDELESRAPAGVHFVGSLPPNEVSERMLKARALVVPSIWYEGQPLALLEGLAAGLPVLAAKIGGLEETVRPLGKGWLVDPADAAAWGQALARLADDLTVDEGGERARARYLEEFSPACGIMGLEKVYKLAQSRRARGELSRWRTSQSSE